MTYAQNVTGYELRPFYIVNMIQCTNARRRLCMYVYMCVVLKYLCVCAYCVCLVVGGREGGREDGRCAMA